MSVALLLLAFPAIIALSSLVAPDRASLERLNLWGAGLTSLTGLTLAVWVFVRGPVEAFRGNFYVDALSAFEVAISGVIGLAAILYSRSYMGHELETGQFLFPKLRRYYALVNTFWLVFLSLCVANNLGLVWIAIEGTTLATAFLVSFYNREASIEAAWKYFVLCTVGISLALMGLILLYYSAIHMSGAGYASLKWTDLAQSARHLDPNVLKLAFAFIIIGYGTKVGLAPMHTWLPDAHSEAPSPVSALLSGMLLNGAMYGVIRCHSLVIRCIGVGLSNRLLILFGLASICIAVPFILMQRDYKRLLAYSSVEHMGIIALGLGFGGTLGTFGALLHTLYHSLIKSTMFFSAGNLLMKYGTREIAGVRGILKALPATGPLFLLGAFAIAGAPPFGLFLSEFTILSAGFQAGQPIASMILLTAIVLVFAGVASHFSRMAFGERPREVAIGEAGVWSIAPLVGLLAIAAGIGIYLPAPVTNALEQIVRIVQGTP